MIEFDWTLESEMMKPTTIESIEDRISQLPICILRNILFHLPLKEETRTCIFSKFWNTHVLSSLPQRSFDFNQIRSIGDDLALYTDAKPLMFIHSGEDSLHRLHSERFKIPYLRITIKVFNSDVSFFIDRWIQLVARNYLGSLYLIIYTKAYLVDLYKFPNIELASVGRLKKLLLCGCKLFKNSLCDNGDEPLAIEDLCLQNVEVHNRGGAFQKFISRCSSLKKLVIKQCYGVIIIRLFNHPKLNELHVKVVRLQGYAHGKLLKRIEVDSLHLKTIICSGVNTRKPLIVKATRCKNLLHLDITSTRMKNNFFENLGTDFPHLQTLCLRGCNGPSNLHSLRHPLLRTLKLYSNDFNQLVIETPKLRVFKYHEYNIPKLDPPCSSLLKNSYQSLFLRQQLNTLSFLQLRDYLTKFNEHCLTLSLHIRSTTEFNMDEVTTLDLPCHVQLLKVRLKATSRNCAALFEGLFWSCRPEYLRVRSDPTFNSVSLKFMCEILTSASKEDYVCCKTHHLKCWRHFLKEATIEGIDPSNIALSEVESMVQQRLTTERELFFTLKWL